MTKPKFALETIVKTVVLEIRVDLCSVLNWTMEDGQLLELFHLVPRDIVLTPNFLECIQEWTNTLTGLKETHTALEWNFLGKMQSY